MKKLTKKDWKYIAIIACLAVAAWFFANLAAGNDSSINDLKFQVGAKKTEIQGYRKAISENNAALSLLETKLKVQETAAATKEKKYNKDIDALKKQIAADRETKPVTGNELEICNANLDECMTQHTAAQLLLLSKDGLIKTWTDKFNLMSDNYKLRGNIIGLNGEIINTWEIAYKKKARRNLFSKVTTGLACVAAGFVIHSILK